MMQSSDLSRQHAATDQLTGLYNRHSILAKIDEILSSSNHAHQPMALIIADVDRFTLFNEKYGQDVGDNALVYIAQILHASIRHNDRASRWGGGEFLILLPGGSLHSAERIAHRIQDKLQKEPLQGPSSLEPVTLTLSVAELQLDEDFNQCLVRADIALQHGKQSGGNRIELAQIDVPQAH